MLVFTNAAKNKKIAMKHSMLFLTGLAVGTAAGPAFGPRPEMRIERPS